MQQLNTNLVSNILIAIILLIIAFTVLADTASDVRTAASSIENESATYPLTSFFKQKGIVLLALMAGLVITLIRVFLPGSGK